MHLTQDILFQHLASASHALNKAKNNSYSDLRKEEYQKQLVELFDKVEQEINKGISNLSDREIYDGPKKYLDFIFKSLEFLDSSTLNQIPYEIVECLNLAMFDWLKDNDKYIIVTSLLNNVHSFSFDPNLAFNKKLYDDIETRYSIKFNYYLVQINLPKFYSKDYLINVVLYHELGHFIDLKSSLMRTLIIQLLDDLEDNKFIASELIELKRYLPALSTYIDSANPKPDWTRIDQKNFFISLSHLQEYFCDLFASQYIGLASNNYVEYLDESGTQFSSTHPSSDLRIKVVSNFINKEENLIVKLIDETLVKLTGNKLIQRFKSLPLKDFLNLTPTEIRSEEELHGLYNAAWDIWLNHRESFEKILNTTNKVKIYKTINNLIEKSIGNYITKKEWSKSSKMLAVNDNLIMNSNVWNPFSDIFSNNAVLSKQSIYNLLRSKKLIITPILDINQIGEIGFDFRLGYDFLVSIQGREAFINASKNDWMQGDGNNQRNITQFFQDTRRQLGETFILHPNQTVLAVTLEYVKLPNDCMLKLFMRSSYSRLGITINTIAQPGYCGCLSMELTNTNNNPINLTIGSRIIQGVFFKTSKPSKYFHKDRKYTCQVRPEPSGIIKDDDLTTLSDLWKSNNRRD